MRARVYRFIGALLIGLTLLFSVTLSLEPTTDIRTTAYRQIIGFVSFILIVIGAALVGSDDKKGKMEGQEGAQPNATA